MTCTNCHHPGADHTNAYGCQHVDDETGLCWCLEGPADGTAEVTAADGTAAAS